MSYLMTPIQNPSDEPERGYNKAHIATRKKIERAFGSKGSTVFLYLSEPD